MLEAELHAAGTARNCACWVARELAEQAYPGTGGHMKLALGHLTDAIYHLEAVQARLAAPEQEAA